MLDEDFSKRHAKSKAKALPAPKAKAKAGGKSKDLTDAIMELPMTESERKRATEQLAKDTWLKAMQKLNKDMALSSNDHRQLVSRIQKNLGKVPSDLNKKYTAASGKLIRMARL